MKNKKIVKILTFALCIITISSVIVFTKDNKKIKTKNVSIYLYDPHPAGGEFPE